MQLTLMAAHPQALKHEVAKLKHEMQGALHAAHCTASAHLKSAILTILNLMSIHRFLDGERS